MLRTKEQYKEVLTCFCRYYLISQKMSHDYISICNFLSKIETTDLIKISQNLKEDSIAYNVWRILSVLNEKELGDIKKLTVCESIEK